MEMAYIKEIPNWFSTRKAAQVTAFFALQAGGSINILRVTKLIYLADRASMESREYPVTGDDFVSMPFGPVNTYTYSHMTGSVTEPRLRSWNEFISSRAGNELSLSRAIKSVDELDELSRADLRILSDTWERFKDITDQFELAEWTHRFCPEWRDPSGSSVPLPFATVFERLKKSQPVELSEQIQAERALMASFIS
tara:strand:- start:2482 stop:3069 length:588 start_codon:yes stop_codon:yes gene_type:complete